MYVFPFSIVTIVGVALVLSTAAADDRPAGVRGTAKVKKETVPRGRVIYNLDCSEFYVGTFGPIAPETIDKFVDAHAALGITDLFINVNAQRVNYRSAVWESDWDGYDPKAGEDQPFFAGIDPNRKFEAALYINEWTFDKQGWDYPKLMIDRARRDHVKPWISLRMNDAHYPDLPNHPYHSTFWKSHPEWHFSYGMDYAQPEVREHYMKLIREVCSRYDLDGLELDFLRFWLYFRAGREHVGAKLMTAFVEEARAVTREAAKRLRHPVYLAVRVPSTPWIARRHGLEAVSWAKGGLVDMIVVSPFWPSVNSDMPIETWKGLLLGTKVPVALGLEGCMDAGSGIRNVTPEEMLGITTSGLQRGADAVYFFNLFTNPYQSWTRPDYDRVVRDAGSYSALCAGTRRHPITITRPWSVGEPGKENALPYTGTNGVFRLHIGPKPLPRQQAHIELVVPDHDEPLEVRLNSTPCPFAGLVDPEHLKAAGIKEPQPRRHVYDVPADALSDGYNLIEVGARQEVKITWVEISVR